MNQNGRGYSRRQEAKKQKQSSNGCDSGLKLRLTMLFATALFLPLLVGFVSLLPLSFDSGFSFSLPSLRFVCIQNEEWSKISLG